MVLGACDVVCVFRVVDVVTSEAMFSKRVLSTMDYELLEMVDRQRKEEGVTRSEFIRRALRRELAAQGVEVPTEEEIKELERQRNWARYRKPGKRYPVPFEESAAYSGHVQPAPPEIPDVPRWQ